MRTRWEPAPQLAIRTQLARMLTAHVQPLRRWSRNRRIECWGLNQSGQLGLGTITASEILPKHVAGLWRDVAAGQNHMCGLDADGHAWCWGANINSQLGISPPSCGNTVVDAGEECDDGNTANGDTCSTLCTIAAPPAEPAPVRLSGDRVYRRIWARSGSTWALTDGGTLWAWGRNGARQLGVGGSTDSGRPQQIVLVAPQQGPDDQWSAVGGGDDHACATQASGSLWCWGSNANGQMGQGTVTGVVRDSPQQVLAGTTWGTPSGGRNFSCAVNTANALHCWGINAEGQLGLGDMMDRFVPTSVDALRWDRVAAGLVHTCALRGDSLSCWGRNDVGQLGGGTTSTTPQLTPAAMLGTWTDVAAGSNFTCAVASDESLWCWGEGANGRLGDGQTTDSPLPVRVMLPPT